jgi:hypothetical protein
LHVICHANFIPWQFFWPRLGGGGGSKSKKSAWDDWDWGISEDAAFLEPGTSSRLAIFNPWLKRLKILDLANSTRPILTLISFE